jgi:hypothetical protein
MQLSLRGKLEANGTMSGNVTGQMIGDMPWNSNRHNHKRCPLFLAGLAGGHLSGNRHIKAADGTPMANALLTLLREFGAVDLPNFGDSTATIDLNS